MKETSKKIVQKAALVIMVTAAAVVGVVCWVGGLASRKKRNAAQEQD